MTEQEHLPDEEKESPKRPDNRSGPKVEAYPDDHLYDAERDPEDGVIGY